MNMKYLWIIIPLCLFVGIMLGTSLGYLLCVYSMDEFEEFACDISTDGMEMCVEMVGYMARYDGYCNESLQQYSIDHNDTIQNFMELYG